jgi:hypothetical protein
MTMGGDYGGGTGGIPPPTFGVGGYSILYPPNILGKKMFRRPRSGVTGGENWRNGVKKGRQLCRCLTGRSTDVVSFRKKIVNRSPQLLRQVSATDNDISMHSS